MTALGFEFGILVLSFVLGLVFTKLTIPRLEKLGHMNTDLHKVGQPKIPGLGGVAIVLAFSLVLLGIFAYTQAFPILFFLISFLIASAIGLWDDWHATTPKERILVTSLTAIPLLAFVSWEIGLVIALFAGVTIASVWTNMLAGLNGVETGTALIAAAALGVVSSGLARPILIAYAAVLLAFLLFNRYPARVFPGNVGTTGMGVVLVASVLLGAPLGAFLILMIPYALDAVLKFVSAGLMSREDHAPSTLDSEGRVVPGRGYLSLLKLIMRVRPMKEQSIVAVVWLFEAALGLGVIVFL